MRSFATRCILVLVAAPLLAAAPLAAQADLSGTWILQVTAFLPAGGTPCEYQGTLVLSSSGNSSWTGPTTLTFVSGPEGCPAEMTATCVADLAGDTVTGTLDGGKLFGMATFTGTLTGGNLIRGSLDPSPSAGKAALAPKLSPDGTFNTQSGTFEGTGGNWLAARQSALEVPTLTETGLLLLTLLLLASASYFLMRRRIA